VAELDSFEWVQSVYKMLAYLGVDPHKVELSYELPGTDSHVAMAFPETKIAFSLEGDNIEGFDKDGWYVTRFHINELQTFSRVFSNIGVAAFEYIRRDSQQNMVKNGSKEEEWLLKGILNANIPSPNRNLRIAREDGSELTTPDFAWENLKVAFFLDGLWWHVNKDDKERIKMINESASDPAKAELVMESNRHKATKDADNRSELASMGWVILSCTDEDVSNEDGVAKQVERISKTLRRRREELSSPKAKKENMPEIII